MDIRQTAFWQGIEEIFPQSPAVDGDRDDIGRSGCLCSYSQFTDRLEMAARRARRDKKFAVLILLQLPREENRLGETSVGQDAGGLLIYRIRSCIRSSDSLCNLGAGRFAMLLEDAGGLAALPVIIEKLYSTLNGRFRTDTAIARRAQPNLGAGLVPVDSQSVARVWLDTETALQQAMASGPGRYRISHGGAGQAEMQQFALSGDLYPAYRKHEFIIRYQPVVGLGDRRVVAIEALLRWQHPLRGCLDPDSFLPLLEDSGLIVPVGEKLLLQACETGRKLTAQGHESLRVCINISFRQLADRGFLLSVLDALYETGLAPPALQLEFAESVLARDTSLVQRILPELRNAGVRLAVDRFGTGETPLADLVRLPLDLIKLDRTLVNGLPDDAVAQTIISGAAAMATATGKAVAAVGVEQPMQSHVLRKLACREAQGSYYFRPLPGGELSDILNG